jgi:hypothetical protein
VRRSFTRVLACILTLGGLAFAPSSASAAFQYVSAELDVFNSSNAIIASSSVTAAAATNGTLYEIANTALANSIQFGNATSLSTGGSAAGPYFVTFGVVSDGGFKLAFSWDPTGNDPYGSFSGNYLAYANPPTQATYTFNASYLLSSTALAAGDHASFILTAVAVPEPASLALLATGGFAIASFGRFRRKVTA